MNHTASRTTLSAPAQSLGSRRARACPIAIVCAACLALPCSLSLAQPATTTPAPKATPTRSTTPAKNTTPPKSNAPANPQGTKPDTATFFEQEPLKCDALGLTLLVPEGAQAQVESMGSQASVTIRDRAGAWEMTVQSRRSSRTDLDLRDVANKAMQQLLDTAGIVQVETDPSTGNPDGRLATTARVLSREPAEGQSLTLRNDGKAMPIERFYVELPPRKGDDPKVQGVVLAQTAPGQFVSFELFTTKQSFDRARQTFELCVGSAHFVDTADADAQRATLVASGLKFVEGAKKEDFLSLISDQPERWERLFRASSTGKREDDTEVGYRRVRLSTGREAGASREGYIVRIDARYMDADSIIDSQSVFHMTYDRKEENWSVRMTVTKSDGKKATHSEIGARNDTAMTVRVEGTGTTPKVISPQIAGDGYISRVESFLLPKLLVRKGVATGFGFYAYQSQAERIAFRRDTVEQPKGTNESWTIRTKLTEDTPESAATYSAKGELASAELVNNVTSEPTTLQTLVDLWKSKGLPLN